jgi:LacI family transcriptional regulator
MKSKVPTLAEVAAAAGVSAMTVSRALHDQRGVSPRTRDAIVKLASEMGYRTNRVALKVSFRQSRVIGVLADHLDNPFISSLVTGVVRAAASANHEVLIYSLVDHEKRPTRNVLKLLQQFTNGVVAVLPYEFGFVQTLTQSRFPVITIETPHQHTEFPSISADSYGGARKAMRHLAELGHKCIAFVSGAEQLESAIQRRRAYDDAISVLGLARDESLILKGNYSVEGGRDAGERLLRLKRRPTAVFACNDLSAFGVISVLQKHGVKVPEDVSVVGFDDLPAASQMHPTLTTVRQPIEELGRTAVNTLLAMIAGLHAATTQVTLPTDLIVRQSTAAPCR